MDADSIISDEEDDYDYEYDYSEDGDSQMGEEDNADDMEITCRDAANPNAPPSDTPTRQSNNSSSRHSPTTPSTWVAKKPAAVSMMPAEALVPEMERRLKDATEALGVPLAAAAPLLRNHQWSVQTLLQAYFADSDRILKNAGVLHRCRNNEESTNDPSALAVATSTATTPKECLICYEDFDDNSNNNKKLAMSCGHTFCLGCWGDYLQNVVGENGNSCVIATCPFASCTEVLTEVEVSAAAPHLLSQFQHYQLRSFVDSNDLARFCPGRGCGRVAHCTKQTKAFVDEQDKIADCDACQTSFCIACGEEPHIPVTCRRLTEWDEKNNNESETANWITANTKTCPKCAARIHKDGGCMYVTCRNCRTGFCWTCMGTHHVWDCNVFKEKGEEENDKQRAKNELERYLHYYQRYHGHAQAQKFAKKQLKKMEKREDAAGTAPFDAATMTTTTLAVPSKADSTDESRAADAKSDKQSATTTVERKRTNGASTPPQQELANFQGSLGGCERDLRFLVDANQQLIKCRRVLKYTYVFAYYKFANNPSLKLQKECFENHQGILEKMTEDLSKVTENPVLASIDQQDVINRTRVIGQFIKNVLEYVDNGMVE